MTKAKEHWEILGKTDPYYAVATFNKFKAKNLDDALKGEFFASGEEHIEFVAREFERYFDQEFRPGRAVDFGCGVGRLAIPLAERSGHVTGVDISEHMLTEARKNCDARGLHNVDLLQTDDFLRSESYFDFVHSFIVFQHIDPRIGMRLVSNLVKRLEPGGVGALHFTYATPHGGKQALSFRLYRDFPLTYKIRGIIKGDAEPWIPIYLYNLDDIMIQLQLNNCIDISLNFTDHGLLGAFIFFRKAA
jgi:SAM-dependent methyltransferase